MALIHRTKTTHCYTATSKHFKQFFSTLTKMYEDQAHTDVHLVSSEGTVFGVHRMVLGGPSSFLRDLFPPEEPCECSTLTVILPDFDSLTIKNLLALLYTGRSAGDCDEDELRQLMDVLGLDVLRLRRQDESSSPPPFKVSRISQSNPRKRTLSSVVPLTNSRPPPPSQHSVSPRDSHDAHPPSGAASDAHDSDEMLEVTPEVELFIGNHFMSDMNGGGHSDEDGAPPPTLRIKKAANLLAEPESNGDSNSQQEEDKQQQQQFLCRLCGRTAPSSAALFAHLLYPHYAHLWRTEIPHRASQYLCKQCPYTTTKRQHFVQHVAKVHEDLKKKLLALGENVEVLDNVNPKNVNASTERIVSKVAKFKSSEEMSYDEQVALSSGEYSNVNSPAGDAFSSDPQTPLPSSTPAAAGNGSASKEGKSKLDLTSFGLIPGRFPRGYKPFVKCRLCGKGWKGKDNFFTHLVSTHFKHMWSNEVPKHADMFHCHVGNCQYQSKYRYNFLFHLAGKHKQLKEKLARDGISLDVLIPIEVDEVDDEMLAGGSPTILKTQSLAMQQHFLNNETNMQKFLEATAPPPNSGGGGRTPSHGKYSAANSTVRLICRVCKKISFNHTCHRQHVVSKHFQDFWADKTPDQTGLFHCHHCDYQTPNRSVFVIHLAYTHSELKTKLKESGNNPDLADPDVYGKRKYRRSHYDNTQHLVQSFAAISPHSSQAGVAPKLEAIDPLEMPPPPVSLATTSLGEAEANDDKHKYICRLCKTEFSKHRAMVEHLALAHFYQVWEDDRPENGSFFVPAEGPFVCPHCPFTSSARANFIAHFVIQHEALKSVMSLQYGNKTVEDLYTVVATGSNEDETYDEGDDDEEEDDIDDDEENADEDMEDMDDEMDGQTSDMEFAENSGGAKLRLNENLPDSLAEASSGSHVGW